MSGDRRAAIVCIHIASGELPILVASRDEPLDDVDSGWQFHCNVHDHGQIEDGRVWAVEEVVEREPSLCEWIDGLPGTRIERASAGESWRPASSDDR